MVVIIAYGLTVLTILIWHIIYWWCYFVSVWLKLVVVGIDHPLPIFIHYLTWQFFVEHVSDRYQQQRASTKESRTGKRRMNRICKVKTSKEREKHDPFRGAATFPILCLPLTISTPRALGATKAAANRRQHGTHTQQQNIQPTSWIKHKEPATQTMVLKENSRCWTGIHWPYIIIAPLSMFVTGGKQLSLAHLL